MQSQAARRVSVGSDAALRHIKYQNELHRLNKTAKVQAETYSY